MSKFNPYTIQALKRFPLVPLNLALALIAGISQGFGLSLFIPLLNSLGENTSSDGVLFNIISKILDYLSIPNDSLSLLIILTITISISFGIIAGQRALLFAYSFTNFVHDTRTELIQAVLKADWKYSSMLFSGETVNKLAQESFRAARSITHLLTAFVAALQALTFIALSAIISFKLVLAIVPLAIIAMYSLRPLHKKSVQLGETLSIDSDRFTTAIVDYLRNLKRIKATGLESQIFETLRGLDRSIVMSQRAHQTNMAIAQFIIQLIPVLMFAITIGTGAFIFNLDMSELLVFLIFLARIAPLAVQAQQAYHGYSLEAPGLEAFFSALNEHTKNISPDTSSGISLSTLKSGIRFDNVTYRYPGAEKNVLESVSIEFKRGQTIGIVGTSGAGKSTIVDLLCGLRRPLDGTIQIDDTDLTAMNLYTWQRKIGYVAQETLLLGATIRENLLVGAPNASENDIWNAIRAAHLEATMNSLPLGLDTILGEGGIRLSGGQRQRLSIAAALVSKPEILILDEATSALDNESERVIRLTIDGLSNEMTIIVIAHRLSTVKKADLIYVMDAGNVVEAGTFNTLIKQGGHFSALHDAGA